MSQNAALTDNTGQLGDPSVVLPLPELMARVSGEGILREILFIDRAGGASPSATDLVGIDVALLAPRSLYEEGMEYVARALATGQMQTLAKRFEVGGQTYQFKIWLSISGPDEVLVTIRDVGARGRAHNEALQLNRALLSVQSAASSVTLSLELEGVLETFNWEMAHLLDASGCAVYTWLREENEVYRAATYQRESSAGQFNFPEQLSLADYPYIRQALFERYARQLNLFEEGASVPEYVLLEREGIRSALLLPMVFQDDVLGLAFIPRWDSVGAFTDQELALAQLLANQTAAAMANAQLYEETQARLREQIALRKASAIFSATLEQEAILRHIAEQMSHAVDTAVVRIRHLPGDDEAAPWLVDYHSPLLADASLAEAADRYADAFARAAEAALEEGHSFVWQPEPGELEREAVALGIPMQVAGRTIAVAELWGQRSQRPFVANAIDLVTSMAQTAAIAMENARLYTELGRRLEELSTLNKISQSITSTLDLQETLTIITNGAVGLCRSGAASVALVDDDEESLWYAAASGGVADFIRGRRLSIDQGVVGHVVKSGQSLLVSDIALETRHYATFDQESGFETRSLICVPLKVKAQTIGAISVFNKQEGSFSQEDLRLLESLATPAATAIENATLYERAAQEIADRKRAEEDLEAERRSLTQRVDARTAELRLANAELARAARLKDEFLASMSHELRTPLNAILGITEGLTEQFYGPLTAHQLHSLQMVGKSGHHLLDLINDILDISKIEAGQVKLQPETISLNHLCQESLLFVRQAAQEKDITLVSDVGADVSLIHADSRRLKQVLLNLLSNAVKFTPEGGDVGLSVRAGPEPESIVFTVWDTGIGIAEEDIPRLFKPFVQLDSSLSRHYSGTGLGLALVARLTELHGGSVRVELRPTGGTAFIVTLPAGATSDTVTVIRPSPSPPATADQPLARQAPIAGNPHILLVDDDTWMATIFAEFLRAMGCRVDHAADGYKALAAFEGEQPDLVLMDIQMPGLSGLDVIRQLRERPDAATTPIIALTALAMSGDRELCLAAGADDYLSKPVPLQRLRHVIEHYLAREGRAESDSAAN